MASVKMISYKQMLDFVNVYYYGIAANEADKFVNAYQAAYHGNEDDACLEIVDENINCYYAVFKNFAHYYVAKKSKSFLLFKDKNRVLVDAGGMIYRYIIDDKKILSNEDLYVDVIQNDADDERSIYFQSIVSPEDELMIIIDSEGIACLNWDGVLWKKPIEWAYAGYFKLLAIKDGFVITQYENISANKDKEHILFEIHSGHSNRQNN